MRPTYRALARYLEAGTPTGLTGLWTHATPRSTLLYLYGSTLSKLKDIPETSLYRQSVEAVTKQRMAIVEEFVPPGHEEWSARARSTMSQHKKDTFRVTDDKKYGSEARTVTLNGRTFVVGERHEAGDVRLEEWNGEDGVNDAVHEGLRSEEERRELFGQLQEMEKQKNEANEKTVDWEEEPQLTADQIKELEIKLGAGLIEEVIQVAEGELQLVETMERTKVWEELEEKPVEGQWTYFERKAA